LGLEVWCSVALLPPLSLVSADLSFCAASREGWFAWS
jgi:hypothetical protein